MMMMHVEDRRELREDVRNFYKTSIFSCSLHRIGLKYFMKFVG